MKTYFEYAKCAPLMVDTCDVVPAKVLVQNYQVQSARVTHSIVPQIMATKAYNIKK